MRRETFGCKPLGGSLVTLTEFRRIDIGKTSVGIKLRNSRKWELNFVALRPIF
jgi:hypothetical protein